MKKIVRLTENNLTRIVKKVIKEQEDFPLERAFNKVIEVLEKGDYKSFIDLVVMLDNEELSEKIFEYLGVPPIPLPDHSDNEGKIGYQKYLFKSIIVDYVDGDTFLKIINRL
jgi:hypothetical protein